MSDRTKRMGLILELAEKDVDAAATAFGDAKAHLASERNKLEDILSYINDYSATSEGEGLRFSPEQLMRQRAFIGQLSQAQAQQRQLIAQREREVEHKKSLWQKAHLKQRAMQDLVKRMSEEAQAQADKKEEKLLDEWAQQQFVRSDSHIKLH